MSLTDVEFSVLRYATDAIIGEPTKYDLILRRAGQAFPRSTHFQRAISYLMDELDTVEVSPRSLGKIATKLAPRSAANKDTPRHLAGVALMASLESLEPRR